MGTDPYQQAIQNAELEAMDMVESMPPPDILPPNFAPNPLANGHLQTQAMQETLPVFADMTDPAAMVTSNHVPLSDAAANAAFLNAMDVVQPTAISDAAFMSGTMSSSDPYGMIAPVDSAMVLEMNQVVAHGSAIPPAALAENMQMTMSTMLEQAHMAPAVPNAQVPVNPTMPTAATPFINPPVPTLPIHQADAITPPQEEVSTQAALASIDAVKEILHDIEKTAKHALQVLPGVEEVTGSKVTSAIPSIGHLNDCISQVTQKFSSLLTLSSALESTTYTPPLQSPNIVLEQKESPLSYPSTSSSASSPMELPAENRKRCASELDERRSVKSLKRESPENVPLSVPYAEPSAPTLDNSQSFPISGIPLSSGTSQASMSLGLGPSVSPTASFSTRGFAPALPPTPTYPSFNNVPMPSPIESSSSSLSHGSIGPPFPGLQTSWSDPVVPTRHHHSSSLESLTGAQLQFPTSDPATPAITDTIPSFLSKVGSSPTTPNTAAMGVPIGRMSRSGSITGTFTPFTFGATLENATEQGSLWTNGFNRVSGQLPAQQSSPVWNNGVETASSSLSPSPVSDRINLVAPPAAANRTSPPTNDDEDDDSDDEDGGHGRNSRQSDGSHGPSAANDVPVEYRAEVERIFFEFLNRICSNLDATDSKGEPIHQTLMAKKMQRLDESPDFRPFKFRIQAFTHAFLEELAKHGYTDDKIPMKKVRNFLWRSPYILRFNEDGKKAKSKGNHIWNIEAKKVGEGKWEFRPFQRKLAGTPPSIAYSGLKWSWSPHVWDPQASLSNAAVEYSSPSLPLWLSWNRNVLSGTPPPDAESCQITANAKFVLDGQDCSLSHTFNLTIAPVKSIENQTIARSRRPSLGTEAPRRTASDSVLFQNVQRAKPRPAPSSADNRVIRVLQSVAQRVTEEAVSQSVTGSPPKESEFQVLVRQKDVLDQSVDAFDKALSGNTLIENRRLAVAAQNVVVQAAHSVLADRTVASGGVPIQHAESVAVKNVTVSELSEATQDAIALAVKQEGTASSGVDIMVAATTILKLRTANTSSENLTTHPSLPARPNNGNTKRHSKISAHPLSSVTEFAA